MTLSEDWKNAQEDRALRKSAVEAAVAEVRAELRSLGRWKRIRFEAWLPWTRLKFSVAHGLGMAHLVYQHVRVIDTEISFVLASMIFRGQSFSEARQSLRQRRGWAEVQYNWQRAMRVAEYKDAAQPQRGDGGQKEARIVWLV